MTSAHQGVQNAQVSVADSHFCHDGMFVHLHKLSLMKQIHVQSGTAKVTHVQKYTICNPVCKVHVCMCTWPGVVTNALLLIEALQVHSPVHSLFCLVHQCAATLWADLG